MPLRSASQPNSHPHTTICNTSRLIHYTAPQDGQSLVEFTKVASLHSGAYFGEIALFNSESTRTATIQAIVNSTYFTLSRKDFEKICPSFPSGK